MKGWESGTGGGRWFFQLLFLGTKLSKSQSPLFFGGGGWGVERVDMVVYELSVKVLGELKKLTFLIGASKGSRDM